MNFGEKVKQLRAERNLTQPQLAQAIGIEQSYLSKLENDKSVPSADVFQAILRAFGVDVAGFLDGIDERVVHRDLKQIPEVANHVNTATTRRIHDIKSWLYLSALACVVGLTIAVAGWRGLVFPTVVHGYSSPGVILPGEPTNIFEAHRMIHLGRYSAGEITLQQAEKLAVEFATRFQQQHRVSDSYLGQGFKETVAGGTRAYSYTGATTVERPQNRWLMIIGSLLTFGGIFGFLVEQRLRRIRVA